MRIKRLSEDSIVARALAQLARMVIAYRWLFVIPQLFLFAGGIFYTYRYLQIDTSREDLVGANKKYHQNFVVFKKEFPTQDDLVVVAESESPEKNRQFVERLGAKLEAEPQLFHDVFYKGDLKMLGAKALLFVPESDLKELEKSLQDYRPFLRQFTQTTNLVSLFNMVCAQFRTAKDEKNAENESLVKALPALERIITQARDSLLRPGTPPSPGVTALFNAGADAEQQMYITFDNGRLYLVTAQAPTEDLNDKAVERLKQLVEETRAEVPGLNVGVTGEPVLDHDEMEQSKSDTTVASIAALILCSLIFVYGYQETGRPVKATICLVIGLGYTLAFATLAVGHLNILTITFVPILIGLAIDYGVHLISRFEEELRCGKTQEAALTRAMVYTGQGILTGGLTTAGAFLAMWLTDFKGIQEMGIICGGGLVVCLVPMMTILPVLLLRGRQNVIDQAYHEGAAKRARIENFWLQRPIWVTVLTLAACGLALTQTHRVYFDYDLLHMQSAGLPAVEFDEKLAMATNATTKSVLYGAVIATNLEEAARLEHEITNLPAVGGIESMTEYLTGDQTHKLEMIGQIKGELAAVNFAEPDGRPVNLPELSSTLYYLYGYLGQAVEAVGHDDPALSAQLLSMRNAILDLRKQMFQGDEAINAVKLAEFQRALFEDVRDTFKALREQDNSAPLRVADLPPAMRDRFIGVTGKYLLMVYPKKDLWQRENQQEFVAQVEKVYPNVTGTPVQLFYYTELLKKSYEAAARYSLIAIVILVWLHFRSPLVVGLSLIPVAVGFIWLGGLMGWLNIPLNPANIMTLPLVIGIGVTNGIHILNRFAEEQTASILARSTGKAVLVSGLTAIAGFGSLILGKHQGIQSLGLVMSIGLATCMIAGLTFLPALLNLLVGRKPSTTASEKATTQCRQCTVGTGSGGTEVKDPECLDKI
jgi:hypothetical protein